MKTSDLRTPLPELETHVQKQIADVVKSEHLSDSEKYRALADVNSYLCAVDNESREYRLHVKMVQFEDGLYGLLDTESDPANPTYLSFETDYCWPESHSYFPTECKRSLYTVIKRAELLEARNKRSKINRFTVE